MLTNKSNLFIAVVAINHLIGLVGLNLDFSRELFEMLTSVNLLLTAVLYFGFGNTALRIWLPVAAVLFTLGMAVEICGVHTQFPFGEYWYLQTLGPQLWGVPLIIGVNWALLTAICVDVCREWVTSPLPRVILAGVLLTLLDVLVEPFAITHNLWVWAEYHPPLENFIAWFVIGTVMSAIYERFHPQISPLSRPFALVLALFFIGDLLLAII